MKHLLLLPLLCLVLFTHSQQPPATNKAWKANWISVGGASPTGYGVYLFRRSLNLAARPSSLPVKVSADNRYKLFVNEKLVAMGPARGDLNNWNYETLDLAPFLQAGNNIIAAQVWNEGPSRPEGQISLQTAFILEAASAEGAELNTDNKWKCIRDTAYSPLPVSIPTYYVSGPGERVNMNFLVKGWKSQAFDDASWKPASVIYPGTPKDMHGPFGIANGWMLVPSMLPQMELTRERFEKTRRSTGIATPPSFPAEKQTITVPANSSVSILLDNEHLTNAYPTVVFSEGKDASVTLTYGEALYTQWPVKGNRNDIEGKSMIGRYDEIISDGSAGQEFSPLTWRTYRYVEMKVTTKDQPLKIDDVYGTFTGYPFKLNARFDAQNELLQQIFDIGWRTARLCAVETYMDCPYYEQLQYIGDTRIQGLISLYNSGDERLLKNAINQMDNSRHADGLTESRHPSEHPQYIPTFSLWYIGMLHDYMMYGADSNFLKSKLNGARQVLQYFKRYQQNDGSLKGVPWWVFTDWVESEGWHEGIAPAGDDGYSAPVDLQLLLAYQAAADLERKIGKASYASIYQAEAAKLGSTIRKKYFDAKTGLFADRTGKDLFSQHANLLAILTGITKGTEMRSISSKLLSDTALAPASIYFKYYLHRALIKAGLGDQYLEWLNKWKENIEMGLTTWAEMSEINTARSDCHAWGSSPNIEFFRTVLGIDSEAPYFSRIRVEPRPGELENIKGEIPHPKGKIVVQLSNTRNKGNAVINLPAGTTGTFVWKGKTHTLKAGNNQIAL